MIAVSLALQLKQVRKVALDVDCFNAPSAGLFRIDVKRIEAVNPRKTSRG
jgi:hypothetical protein